MACTLVNETCPAAVSTVTLVTNQILVDGDETNFIHDELTPDLVAGTLTLTALPIAGTLKVFKNGQLLTPDVDYTVADLVVTLTVAPLVADVYIVSYLAQPA